jgi:hypothetical protein
VLYGEPLGWSTLIANVLIVGAIALALTGRRRHLAGERGHRGQR